MTDPDPNPAFKAVETNRVKPKPKRVQTPLSIPAASIASLLVYHGAGAYGAGDALFLANAFSNAAGTVIVGLVILIGLGCFCGYLGMTCGLMLIKAAPARPVGYIVMGYLGLATLVFLGISASQGSDGLELARAGLTGVGSMVGAWLVVREKERRAARNKALAEARAAAKSDNPDGAPRY